MNSFQAMVSRVARAAVAGLSPADRKKMVMETFKRFKGMGDGALKGGKHQIFLAAEGYETVTLEDASDAELSRIHSKYILGKKATSAQRVAETSSVSHMRRSLTNLTQAGARLRDAEGYVGGSLDLLVEALGFVKSANSDISDEDTEALEKELTALIRRVGQESRAITSWIRELRVKANEAREQYESEIDYELQHPGE